MIAPILVKASGILDVKTKRVDRATVIQIGELETDLKVGDKLIIESMPVKSFEDSENGMIVIDEDQVLAKIQDDDATNPV